MVSIYLLQKLNLPRILPANWESSDVTVFCGNLLMLMTISEPETTVPFEF